LPTGLIAVLYRTAQELNWLPKDEVGFPFLVLLTWILFLYWIFTGSRAVRWYSKAHRSWAERRIVTYFLVISIGAVIGGATAGAWWKLFEIHRAQMSKLKDVKPPPVNAAPPEALPSTKPKQMPMPKPTEPGENTKHYTHGELIPKIAADVGEIRKNTVPTQRRLTDEQQKKLASLLRASGIFETAVRHTVGNADAQRYADTFANAITSSGWSLRQPKFLIP
jgi:hypothetical protein